jgi:SAM-dependent methyltransferase
LITSDLGSITDLNLLYSFSPRPQQEKTLILEIGAGYGRLAEAAFNIFNDSIRYVLVDSVPGSLYYAKRYLEAACPKIRIGSYYYGDAFDIDKFECYVVPSWHFSALNTLKYDICINIESFQEMPQEHVDYYLRLFDDVTRDGATIYISNAHDYLFKGDWNFPKNWRKLLCSNTPRSWTRDHPTEVFEKSVGDFSVQNAAIDANYRYSLERSEEAEIFLLKTGVRRMLGPIVRHSLRRVGQLMQSRGAGTAPRRTR